MDRFPTSPPRASTRLRPARKKCPLILLGRKGPALLIDGAAKPFDPATFGACMTVAPVVLDGI